MSVPRLVHIGFMPQGTPINGFNFDSVKDKIEANAIDWVRYSGVCYLVWTHLELAHWTSIFETVPNMRSTNLFICAIDPNSPVEGWLPEWAWN